MIQQTRPCIDTEIRPEDVTSGRDVWEIARERFACACSESRLTLFHDKAGRPSYRLQCPRCGKHENVRKTELSPREMSEAPPWDDDAGKRWYEARYAFSNAIHDARRVHSLDSFRGEEGEFLRSAVWQDMRRRVMTRAGGMCEGCQVRRAVQVHHRNYDRKFGREMLFDLVAVCRECHTAIHNPDDLRVS